MNLAHSFLLLWDEIMFGCLLMMYSCVHDVSMVYLFCFRVCTECFFFSADRWTMSNGESFIEAFDFIP